MRRSTERKGPIRATPVGENKPIPTRRALINNSFNGTTAPRNAKNSVSTVSQTTLTSSVSSCYCSSIRAHHASPPTSTLPSPCSSAHHRHAQHSYMLYSWIKSILLQKKGEILCPTIHPLDNHTVAIHSRQQPLHRVLTPPGLNIIPTIPIPIRVSAQLDTSPSSLPVRKRIHAF